MSIIGVKSLTVRAKKSISGYNPFSDGSSLSQTNVKSSTPGKENDTLDLEEFGVSPKYAPPHGSGAPPSPAADSPSRRKKLIGSLRRMSSMRSVKSPPTKDRGKQRALSPYPHSPSEVEHLRKPAADIELPLALNFQQSPSDGPTFDTPERKCSDSFALVHHSAPILIPSLVKQDVFTCSMPWTPLELPPGTVPGSPAPLQKALETDPDQSVLSAEASPIYPHTRLSEEPVPTPLPGTNVGFDDSDTVGPSSSLVRDTVCSGKPGNCFNVLSEHNPGVVTRISPIDITCDNESADPEASIVHLSGRKQASTVKIDGGPWIPQHLAAAANPSSHDAMLIGYFNCTNDDRIANDDSTDHTWSLEDRLPAFWVRPDADRPLPRPLSSEHNLVQLRTQAYLQKRANSHVAPDTRPITSDVVGAVPTPWGTHGSLYDGTGYGDDSNSISPRPSVSFRSGREAITDTMNNSVYTAEANAPTFQKRHVQGPSSLKANAHEMLDDAICAYAVQEKERASAKIDTKSEGVAKIVVADRPQMEVGEHDRQSFL